MAQFAAVLRPAWVRVNTWSPAHSLVFAWAMYFGTYVVLRARLPGIADALAPTVLLAILLTGLAARWVVGISIVAAVSLLWWLMGFQGIELDFGRGTRADAFATFLFGTVLLGIGRGARLGWDASRLAAARRVEVAALEARHAFQVQFLNMAAHEINTPLTPIKLQLASLLPKAEEHRAGLERIRRNVERLERLTGDLADAGKIQQGGLYVAMDDLDVAGVVRDILADASDAAAEKGIELASEVTDPLPVRADRHRIEQVVWNLVRNAIRYTPHGGRVLLRAWQDDGVHVRVEDTGLGMTPEQIADAGAPFTQFHRDQVSEGTGLGLFISRGILEAHRGTLSIASDGPHKGTAFTVSLPAAPKA